MPSEKILEAKQATVNTLADELRQAKSIILAEYRGLTVAQDTQMRAELRKAGVIYKVIKNTMLQRAIDQIGLEGLDEMLKGPTAVAYSKDDLIAPAKLIKEYSRQFDKLKIKGGVLEGKIIGLDEIDQLASIPSQEVLYGQLVFTLLSPVTCLAIVLNAIKEKMENEAEPTPAEQNTEA
ncbi:MAG: 50S ribosomal protein L10 [Clostridia bacterium]|nr:50S ribosomal protein L10 [Clostridia bacterium]